jgi:hypothetical protein
VPSVFFYQLLFFLFKIIISTSFHFPNQVNHSHEEEKYLSPTKVGLTKSRSKESLSLSSREDMMFFHTIWFSGLR